MKDKIEGEKHEGKCHYSSLRRLLGLRELRREVSIAEERKESILDSPNSTHPSNPFFPIEIPYSFDQSRNSTIVPSKKNPSRSHFRKLKLRPLIGALYFRPDWGVSPELDHNSAHRPLRLGFSFKYRPFFGTVHLNQTIINIFILRKLL